MRPCGSRPGVGPIGVLVVLALVAGCRVDVTADDAAFEVPAAAAPAGTVRVRCAERVRRAAPLRTNAAWPLAVEPVRLIPAGGELLIVAAEGGLHRFADGRTTPLLGTGKDYDLVGDTLYGLEAESVAVHRYVGGGWPVRLQAVVAQSHDLSLAAGPGRLYLHSVTNPGHDLVLEREPEAGTVRTRHFPVRRNLVQGLLTDPDRVLRAMGAVRARDGWLAFVPAVEDPLLVARPAEGDAVAIALAEGRTGRLATRDRRVIRDEQECPTCTRHVAMADRLEIEPLYGGSALEPGALWTVLVEPSDSSRQVLYRVALEPRPGAEVRAWRLAFDHPPRAIAWWRDALAVATSRRLVTFDRPPGGAGVICDVGVYSER